MNILLSIISILQLLSYTTNEEIKFTGSTPADIVVRRFLDIPISDSIDFIRWKLNIEDDSKYTLHCNYGICKPNTNGFINGGKTIEISGRLKKENNIYTLENSIKQIKLERINNNLLHFLNEDNSLLIGNGGWSYTLNNLNPTPTDDVVIKALKTTFRDSLVLEGRTPCGVPGILAPDKWCYKLKWRIIFYEPKRINEPGNYFMIGTPWYEEGGKRGTWNIIPGKNGRIVYHLKDEKEKLLLQLLKLDEGIMIFTDKNGNLLVGDLDFSYTLNKIK